MRKNSGIRRQIPRTCCCLAHLLLCIQLIISLICGPNQNRLSFICLYMYVTVCTMKQLLSRPELNFYSLPFHQITLPPDQCTQYYIVLSLSFIIRLKLITKHERNLYTKVPTTVVHMYISAGSMLMDLGGEVSFQDHLPPSPPNQMFTDQNNMYCLFVLPFLFVDAENRYVNLIIAHNNNYYNDIILVHKCG